MKVRVMSTRLIGVVSGVLAVSLVWFSPPSAAGQSSTAPPQSGADEQTAASLNVSQLEDAPEVSEAVADLPPRRRLWTLQMNLCSDNRPSTGGSCDTADDPDRDGEEIAEGGELMTANRPDIVTLNEICENDWRNLFRNRWSPMWPSDYRYALFMPVGNYDASGPLLCKNGERFGIGIMIHVPESEWQGRYLLTGWYQEQYGGDEQRAYACVYAIGAYFGCVTHLTSKLDETAMTQCAELEWRLDVFVDNHGGYRPTVIGADFNLRAGDDDEPLERCMPDLAHVHDFEVQAQAVLSSATINFDGTHEVIPMTYTDHPALLVKLRDSQLR